ncbi:MAG: hypothetical protein RPR28_06355 [Cycloclasticus sp.]
MSQNIAIEIAGTEFNVEEQHQDDDGVYSLTCWLKIDSICDGKELELSMQFDGGSGFDLFDMESNEIHGALHDAVAETDCFDTLNTEYDAYIEDLKLQYFKNSEDYEEVEALSRKINEIIGNKEDYLMLAKGYFEADNIDIGYAMCSLQIYYDMTQDQSRQVVDLF